MGKILVTGGLGFIGSHAVVALHEAGYVPIILDDLRNSRISVLDGIEKIIGLRVPLIIGDVNNPNTYPAIFENGEIEAVIHFAADKAVGESVANPLKYYRNNVGGLISLLEAMGQYNITKLVFSSSCTVYGEPDTVPVTENSLVKPAVSPYGATKQICEQILQDVAWCQTQCLRYFNPVGAHHTGVIGELPLGKPNNLVPFITQTAAGKYPTLTVHGKDYPTPDGTCIRDYIHVMDLAEAHVASLKRLLENKNTQRFETFNIGTGQGFSVTEVIQAFERESSVSLNYQYGPRRDGDVTEVWADTQKAISLLGWQAKRTLSEMMRDAWNWQLHAPLD